MPPEAGAIQEWLLKARSDWRAAETLREGAAPETDIIGFHCQQAVKKLFKAYLAANDAEIERIHDLRRLVEQCAALDPAFEALREAVRPLTAYAVVCRYPGLPGLTQEEAEQAVVVVRKVWEFVVQRVPAAAVPPATKE